MFTNFVCFAKLPSFLVQQDGGDHVISTLICSSPRAMESDDMDPGGGDDDDPACSDWSDVDKMNFVIWQRTAGDKSSKVDFTNYLVSCDKKVGKILDHVQIGLHSLQRL